jgi:hypothetical protein
MTRNEVHRLFTFLPALFCHPHCLCSPHAVLSVVTVAMNSAVKPVDVQPLSCSASASAAGTWLLLPPAWRGLTAAACCLLSSCWLAGWPCLSLSLSQVRPVHREHFQEQGTAATIGGLHQAALSAAASSLGDVVGFGIFKFGAAQCPTHSSGRAGCCTSGTLLLLPPTFLGQPCGETSGQYQGYFC